MTTTDEPDDIQRDRQRAALERLKRLHHNPFLTEAELAASTER